MVGDERTGHCDWLVCDDAVWSEMMNIVRRICSKCSKNDMYIFVVATARLR